jgi:D-alanyl-D-alanine carboxypeptidase
MPSARPRSSLTRQIGRRLGIPVDYGVVRGLAQHPEAARLVAVGHAPDDGKLVRLAPRAAAAWREMRAAAARDGIVLLPLSGFRSVARQAVLIRKKLAAGESIEEILRLVAAPGYSEHHTGRALDIGSPDDIALDEEFARTAAFRWLRRHAGEFGFQLSFPRRNPHGIAYEPWHWCWRPARVHSRRPVRRAQ